MKKMLLVLFLVIAFCSGLQSQGNKNTDETKNWNKHIDTAWRYRIKFPGEWELNANKPNAKFFLFSPLEGDEDRFRENINLQARMITDAKLTLKQYVNLNVEELKGAITEMKVLSQKDIMWNGKPAYEMIYTGKMEGVSFALKLRQRYMIYKTRAYVLTYCADAEKEDKYSAGAEKIMNTFMIK